MKTSAQLIESDMLIGLDFLWLELTNKCNLECVHCYADSSPRLPLRGNLTIDDWKNVLAEASITACRKVQFIGGEPTLSPYLSELIHEARITGYTFIEVFTNGTHFSDKDRNAFVTEKVNLAFSVYSSDPSIHDAVTLHRGSHVETINNIKWAVDAGLDVRVAIINVGINADLINSTKTMLLNIGVKNISIDRNRGIGRGAHNERSTMEELCGKCWKGKLCVTPSGEVFPCVFSRFIPIGNIQEGLSSILSNDKLMNFRAAMKDMQRRKVTVACNPSADPLCSPDECSPNECEPEGGCTPDCSPEAYCAPEHDDKDDCSPMTGGCSPNE